MAFDDIIDADGMAARLRQRRRRALAVRVATIILAVIAAFSLGFPILAQYRTARDLATVAENSEDVVAGWPAGRVDRALAAARDYNRRLAKAPQSLLETAVADGSVNGTAAVALASGDSASSSSNDEYDGLLNTGNGVMGTIRIPKISVDLPIYHGTSATALTSGIGHLQGSSLPVGGASTHAVLTGHRGLIKAAMFTRLDEMREGDEFFIDVLGKTLRYRVDRIAVIDPDDTTQLAVTPGEDRVTLMTCTPYGVNTHRLLVSGIREDDGGSVAAASSSDVRSYVFAVVAAVTVAGGLLIHVVRSMKASRSTYLPPIRHAAA
ncbi:class C sortase [Bifidobacterium aerophilum]|nr:class C sortase [Bifidobacterium aerophilum]